MISIFIKTIVAILFTASSVDNTDTYPMTPVFNKAYENCCGSEPVELKNENSYIYIPNAFLVGSKKNDRFMPFCSDNIQHINYMSLYMDSDTSQAILYEANELSMKDLNESSWDGKIAGTERVHEGSFSYEIMFVTKEGKPLLLKGKSCAITCSAENDAVIARDGCFYPEQFDRTLMQLDNKIKLSEECF